MPVKLERLDMSKIRFPLSLLPSADCDVIVEMGDGAGGRERAFEHMQNGRLLTRLLSFSVRILQPTVKLYEA